MKYEVTLEEIAENERYAQLDILVDDLVQAVAKLIKVRIGVRLSPARLDMLNDVLYSVVEQSTRGAGK
jgi:hypothetical protein